MLLGFKKRFAEFVVDGSKTHTIRSKRKRHHPRPNELCHCYTGLRTKGASLLGRWPCVRVQDVTIELLARQVGFTLIITIDDVELTPSEASAFAFRDGFRGPNPLTEMRMFWIQTHGACSFPFHGDLIHWRFE